MTFVSKSAFNKIGFLLATGVFFLTSFDEAANRQQDEKKEIIFWVSPSTSDKDWSKAISGMILIPLEEEEIFIMQNQLKLRAEQVDAFKKFQILAAEGRHLGRQQMSLAEAESRIKGRSKPEPKLEKEVSEKLRRNDADLLSQTKLSKEILSSASLDIQEWIFERNFIMREIALTSSSKENESLKESRNRAAEILGRVERSFFFEDYINKKNNSVGGSKKSEAFLYKHNLQVKKLALYMIYRAALSDTPDKKDKKIISVKINNLFQEILSE